MSNNKKSLDVSDSFREFLIGLSRPAKQSVAFGVDIIGFTICACATELLLRGTNDLFYPIITIECVATAIIAVLLAWMLGLYRSIVRYMGLDLYIAGAKVAAGSAVVGSALMYLSGFAASPVRWAVVYWCVAFIFICSSRVFARSYLIHRRARMKRDRVIIYGAGSAGAQLAIGLLGGDEFLPVAFVDDDPVLQKITVKGLVVHSPSAISELIGEKGATRVLLAIPSASRRRRRVVLERLSHYPVHVQTMPGVQDLVSGKARVDDIRDVDVKDLLGRDPVPPIPDLIGGSVSGKNVMITGAGGSIGSELCRQIIRLNPSTLVLLELSEVALYHIEKEVQSLTEEMEIPCKIIALLGSVHHEARIEEAMVTFNIDTIYHAAAYKHVPLVEHNILEGVHNNVLGTLFLAQAAVAAGVETFVLISTDKAVSPTSVMGATKRFAELVLQAMQVEHPNTRFCMVRFGNVLESSGSVVPLFRKQIRSGGPVTVTHRDIIRYFMTIPEAALLVIQAASMARGGDVFVLDMGEPVRIFDLARRMIRLMGLTVRDADNPDGDIEVIFTGLRPAEKLYEELLIGANVSGTDHPRIMRANEDYLSLRSLSEFIEELQSATSSLDRDRTRDILMRAIKEYGPSNGIEDLVWVSQRSVPDDAEITKIVEFPS